MGLKNFVEGGIASVVAGCSTHPLDLIKVRMQLQGEHCLSKPIPHILHLRPVVVPSYQYHHSPVISIVVNNGQPLSQVKAGPIGVGLKIVETEGVAALYSGVSATVLRQLLYSSTSLGLYGVLKQKWSDPSTGHLPLGQKIAAGLVAGGIGAAVGNPADVAMVRMQADGRLPVSQRRNYNGVIDAITKMSREEGIVSLWRGSSLTVKKAMIVTASQLASYDQFKEAILDNGVMGDGLGTHVTASFAAGFLAAAA